MKQILTSTLLLGILTSVASADALADISAHVHSDYSFYTQTSLNMGGGSDTADFYGDTSLYAGGGGFSYLNDQWTYSFDTFTEEQYETASAEAYSYGRFDRSANFIDVEVYGYSTSLYSTTGSQAYATANSIAFGSADVTFRLVASMSVTLSISTLYGDGYLALYQGGNLIVDTNMLGTQTTPFYLGAGDYQIAGSAGNGGANMSIQAQAVPEPATLAALAVGGLAVLRKRRR